MQASDDEVVEAQVGKYCRVMRQKARLEGNVLYLPISGSAAVPSSLPRTHGRMILPNGRAKVLRRSHILSWLLLENSATIFVAAIEGDEVTEWHKLELDALLMAVQ